MAARVIFPVAQSLGFRLEDLCLSRETLRRVRETHRQELAGEIQNNCLLTTKLIVQWDEELLPDL